MDKGLNSGLIKTSTSGHDEVAIIELALLPQTNIKQGEMREAFSAIEQQITSGYDPREKGHSQVRVPFTPAFWWTVSSIGTENWGKSRGVS